VLRLITRSSPSAAFLYPSLSGRRVQSGGGSLTWLHLVNAYQIALINKWNGITTEKLVFCYTTRRCRRRRRQRENTDRRPRSLYKLRQRYAFDGTAPRTDARPVRAISAKYGGLIYIPRLNRLCVRACAAVCIRLINLPEDEIGKLQRRTRRGATRAHAHARLPIRRYVNKNKRHQPTSAETVNCLPESSHTVTPLSAPQPSGIPRVTM